MSNHAAKKLPNLLQYVPNQYMTQQMSDKAILENERTVNSVPDWYRNHGMCNKAVDNYHHVLDFTLECYKTQKVFDKDVNTYPLTIKFVPEWLITQEMCDKPVTRCLFLFDSIPNQ